ncbi:hypothetical protein Acr_12g0002680 [Actinidia rufa]|uniref:Uncharacterized protein n=1 Tax=Actinidia rufa TaxID=165716 RepID=A0A7J0FIJ3_9ERIC|nr:hypothetical protein Acr_12g0002680 [Actinidia rufa]
MEEEILLHLKGRLRVLPEDIQRCRSSKGPEVVGHARCFKLDSKSMAYSSEDNGEDIPTGDAALIVGDKAMSKKISLKKLVHLARVSKSASPAVKLTSAVKGVIIGEICPKDEVPDILPSKKGKLASNAKKKGHILPLEEKKKGSSVKVPTKAKASSSKAAIKVAIGESTSVNPSAILGLNASILENPAVVEKLLKGVIPPLDKEEAEKLDLDLTISRLFHGVGQEKKAMEEFKKIKEEWDATMGRLEAEMARIKKNAIAEFKALNEFQEAIEFTTSKYFGEGFNFYKRYLAIFIPTSTSKALGLTPICFWRRKRRRRMGRRVIPAPSPLKTLVNFSPFCSS